MSRAPLTRDQRILANLGLVEKIVKAKYPGQRSDFDDLVQAGTIGLILAADSYEADKVNGQFAAYARVCIISEITQYRTKSSKRVTPARRYYERVAIRRHAKALSYILQREPTTLEIRDTWPTDKVPSAAAVERATTPDPIIESGREDGPEVELPDDDPYDIEDIIDAKRAFELLSEAKRIRLLGGSGA